MTRLFCVTVYVFDHTGNHSLFMNHRKLGRWMPPGGKVDPNELPDDTAVRECLEETGAHVTLLGEKFPSKLSLIRPYGMQLNSVIPNEKDHIDFVYLAVADKNKALTLNERESLGVHWFEVATILKPDFNTFEETKYWVKRLAKEVTSPTVFGSFMEKAPVLGAK